MIAMTLARVQKQEKLLRTTVALVDEPHQRALLLWFMTERDFSARMRMFSSAQQQAAAVEPSTADLIMNILRALQGTLTGIEILTLQGDILHARINLHGLHGVPQQVSARLDNALALAIEAHCPITVDEKVLERQGITLADFGETFEQQLDNVVRQAQQSFRLGPSQAISNVKVPRDLEFTEDFHGWSLMGYPETPKNYAYQLDSSVTYRHKVSLAIALREESLNTQAVFTNSFVLLLHEGFIADNYQGKRLRMVAYLRAQDVKQGVFNLHINGPAREADGMEPRVMYMTSNQHEPIEGTSDWRPYELVIDVPQDAATIQCGFSMEGSGKVWLDSFQFEVVDTTVPLTGTRITPPARLPVNLTFEQQLDGWLIAGSRPQDYTCRIDATEQGQRAMHIKNAVDQPRGSIILQQVVNAYDYRGKAVQLSASVRATNVSEQASLYLAQGMNKDNRIERTMHATTDWQAYSISLTIPDEPGQIEFGLMLYGPGQVWLRDVKLTLSQLA